MKNITFSNTNQPGKVVNENDLFTHIHNPAMFLVYDYNFLQFKRMPNLEEFKDAAQYLKTFHERHNQKHERYYFPENEYLTSELLEYLEEEYYDFSFLELYAIHPNQFPIVNENPEITIEAVSTETLVDYLKFQYDKDIDYGNDFADQKQKYHVSNFYDENVLQIIAYVEGSPAGTVDVYLKGDTAEIDSLYVLPFRQKKGIGSLLQKYVMNQFANKTVILMAAGEDTPRVMYRKQNYQFLGFRYEALKINI